MKNIYCLSTMIPYVSNSFGCNICGNVDILETLKSKLQKLKIEQNNINTNTNNYEKINSDNPIIKQINNNNNNEKVVKKESIIDVTEYFIALNEYNGKEYQGKETFNKGFDELNKKFKNDIENEVDYDFAKIIKYLVIEGTVKVPKNATLDSLKKEYWDNEKEKNLYNLIKNCIDNGYKFYVYLDNLNKDLKYDSDFRPRNKKAKKELNLNDVNQGIIDKHKDKELIILYVLRKGEAHVFTTQE